jgi:hypothetical protein
MKSTGEKVKLTRADRFEWHWAYGQRSKSAIANDQRLRLAITQGRTSTRDKLIQDNSHEDADEEAWAAESPE